MLRNRKRESSNSQDETMIESVPVTTAPDADKGVALMDDETALPQQALAMSMGDPSQSGGISNLDADTAMENQNLALARQLLSKLLIARQLLVQNSTNQASQSDMNQVLGDQSFMSSILASLPGVDPNDPWLKDLLCISRGAEER